MYNNTHVYAHICVNNKKGVMNLKESKRYICQLGGRKKRYTFIKISKYKIIHLKTTFEKCALKSSVISFL